MTMNATGMMIGDVESKRLRLRLIELLVTHRNLP
jgi:hypothetical protein